jgi:3-oxoacyl-[acyl-carrier protein] reductase
MRTAIVTGVAGGIGGRLAEALAEGGYHVICVDISERVGDVARSLTSASFVQADLTDKAGLEAVVAAVEAAGGLDLLVNNAGITRDARLIKMESAQFEAVIAVNLGSVYQLTIQLVPHLQDGGSIVSISSRAYLGNFGQYNYSMSKGGVVGLTRALALDLAPRIRVNAIAPGLIETPMAMAIPDEVREKMVEAVPLKKMGQPSDIAEAVAWLADDKRSGYVTGHVLVVGGGRSLI